MPNIIFVYKQRPKRAPFLRKRPERFGERRGRSFVINKPKDMLQAQKIIIRRIIYCWYDTVFYLEELTEIIRYG